MAKKVLWFNWKDIKHPEAGGAEIVTHDLAKKLVQEGHEVTLVTARYKDSTEKDVIDGINIIRVGSSRVSHYPSAISYYLKNLKNKFDLIIEEVNTIPYFLNSFKGKEELVLYYNQLTRKVWFYQMAQPISTIGYYIAEPIYTWFQGLFRNRVITISQSSKNDLIRFGFNPEKIELITMYTTTQPLDLYQKDIKESEFTVLFHSSLRPMKRPIEVFKGFKILLEKYPEAKLWISGGGDQTTLREYATVNGFIDSVIFFGRTTESQKLDLMQKASVLCATSMKEGWGLIVTEANSMATPCVVYDVDGLRDASKAGHNWTVEPNSQALGKKLIEVCDIFTKNQEKYDQKCQEVLDCSRFYTVDQCYNDFKQIVWLS